MSLLVSPQKTLFYSVSDIQGIQDYVVSGLTSETPSGLTMATNAGQAFVDGLQISAAASSHAYTANKFTSDDLQSTGAIIHREYASYIDIPSLPPSGLRLRMVQTDAGAITGVFDRRTREAMLELLPETPFSWRKILDELTIGDDDYPGGTAVKKFNGAYRYAPNNGIIWYFSNT